MNTINNYGTQASFNVTNNNSVTRTENNHKVHKHHKESEEVDSVNISSEGKRAEGSSSKSFLDALVANGTITEDQENSIKSAFQSSRQGQAGIYGKAPTNPIGSLVSNGTITKSQADSITSAFKSKVDVDGNKVETNGQDGKVMHHHHHKVNDHSNLDGTAQVPDSADSILNNILNSSNSQDALINGQSES